MEGGGHFPNTQFLFGLRLGSFGSVTGGGTEMSAVTSRGSGATEVSAEQVADLTAQLYCWPYSFALDEL